MKCLELEALVPDFLTGSLPAASMQEIESHLRECAACRSELQDLCELWAQLGVMPMVKPSTALRAGFYRMLKDASAQEPVGHSVSRRWRLPDVRNTMLQIAAGILLVAGGWLAGLGSAGHHLQERSNLQLASTESSQGQQIDLSLLEKPNISKRMLGVVLIAKAPVRNASFAEVLLDLLYEDPSVQVRLAAVDALYPYSDVPWIREELEKALFVQNSPLTQMALVDLLKDQKDEGTQKALSSFVQDQRVSPDVRERALSALSIDPCNLSSLGEYSYYLSPRMTKAQAAAGAARKAPGQAEGVGVARNGSQRRNKQKTQPRTMVPWYVTYYSTRSI